MSFFNRTRLVLACASLISISVTAGPTLSEEDMNMFSDNNAMMQKTRDLDAPSWMRQYDPTAPVEKTDKGVRRWIPAAQKIGNDTSEFIQKTIGNAYGVEDKSQIKTIDMRVRKGSPIRPDEELYYFVSFSQPESEIKEILQAASEVDARVILRGMRPGDKMVNHTAAAMYALGKEIRPLPKVAIDSRLYKVFDIQAAPAMVYRRGKQIVKVKGVATAKWFLSKSREDKDSKSLGSVSGTYEIVERDVIEELQARAAQIDWERKRKEAVKRYINKLPDYKIPTATEDAIYQINPRVQFTKDSHAKDGSLLAAKGQVVNPLKFFPGQEMTLFFFDPLSEKQVALVKEQRKSSRGQLQYLMSRIDKDKGFQFISDMSKEFKQQVYLMQSRMIERFQIRHLPAQVYLGNGKIVVKEYGIAAQEEALHAEREAEFLSLQESGRKITTQPGRVALLETIDNSN